MLETLPKRALAYRIDHNSEKYNPANIPAMPAMIAAVIRQIAMCPPEYFFSGVRRLFSSVTTTVGEAETPAGTTVMDVGAAV